LSLLICAGYLKEVIFWPWSFDLNRNWGLITGIFKVNTILLFEIITSRIQHVYGTRFLANPDVQVFDKLKKEELLSLGLHFGLEVKSSMKNRRLGL
jgi:hypothetical protein